MKKETKKENTMKKEPGEDDSKKQHMQEISTIDTPNEYLKWTPKNLLSELNMLIMPKEEEKAYREAVKEVQETMHAVRMKMKRGDGTAFFHQKFTLHLEIRFFFKTKNFSSYG